MVCVCVCVCVCVYYRVSLICDVHVCIPGICVWLCGAPF